MEQALGLACISRHVGILLQGCIDSDRFHLAIFGQIVMVMRRDALAEIGLSQS